ncbi:MAG: hypothetical protein DMF86_18260 [Acidobacteria bacterium]|nr:MAG: hypothetical protein DMF86_18260 [Acidobacteriota bacterium]
MRLRTSIVSVISFVAGAVAAGPLLSTASIAPAASAREDDRAADRKAIRAHIDKIFAAYIERDCATIRATHSKDWVGFTGVARSVVSGLDQYMNSSAPFCRSAGQANANPEFGLVDYKLTQIDYVFHGDVALVPYVAETVYGRAARVPGKLRSLDVYEKQHGEWNQVGSNIYLHPDAVDAQLEHAQDFRALPAEERRELLTAREAVWRAFFANDQARLQKLLPEETIALEGHPEATFENRAQILNGAQQLGGRAKLVRLEFPRTDVQAYGDVAIIYTTYLYELESAPGQKETTAGHATEIFVKRNGAWLNSGWHLAANK